jgi:hypothetical protein
MGTTIRSVIAAAAVAAATFGLGMTAAKPATVTVTIPDPGAAGYIYFGSGDVTITYDGVVFSQSGALSDGDFFNVGVGFSSDPAVLSSQQQSVGEPNILITLPGTATSLSLNYGTFDGSNVTFALSSGGTFTQGSTGNGYAVPDFFSVSGSFSSVLVTSTDSVLSLNNLTYSAVPEASTWAMMLLGFAGLGYAGYRSRKAISIAA